MLWSRLVLPCPVGAILGLVTGVRMWIESYRLEKTHAVDSQNV